MITVSIVSHDHGHMINELLNSLVGYPEVTHVILTKNVPEQEEPIVPSALTDHITVLRNTAPKGFGANHNTAFTYCDTPYYCILNPDIQLDTNPFPTLLHCLKKYTAALCAPAVVDPTGAIEDNARYFPSVFNLFIKLFGVSDGRYQYQRNSTPFYPDWVAGMFMLFVTKDYSAVNGFDASYFLYYEDVDLCTRLQHTDRKIILCPQSTAIHNAQRASHHNLKHMRWHLNSMVQYLWKHRNW